MIKRAWFTRWACQLWVWLKINFNPFIPALVWREEKREKEMECSTVSSVAAASINQQETLEEENLGPQPIVKLEVFKGVGKSYF